MISSITRTHVRDLYRLASIHTYVQVCKTEHETKMLKRNNINIVLSFLL